LYAPLECRRDLSLHRAPLTQFTRNQPVSGWTPLCKLTSPFDLFHEPKDLPLGVRLKPPPADRSPALPSAATSAESALARDPFPMGLRMGWSVLATARPQ